MFRKRATNIFQRILLPLRSVLEWNVMCHKYHDVYRQWLLLSFSNLSPWHGMSLHVQRLIRTSDVLQQRNDSIGKGRRYGDNAGMFRRRVLIHVYVLPLGSVLERNIMREHLIRGNHVGRNHI